MGNIARAKLVASLTKRAATQDVLKTILTMPTVVDALPAETVELMRPIGMVPSHGMTHNYAIVDSADDQLQTLSVLFPDVPEVANAIGVNVMDRHYVALLRNVLTALYTRLGVDGDMGAVLARNVRSNPATWGDYSQKAFLKRARAVRRFEEKVDRVATATIQRNALMTAKARLARLVDASVLDDVSLAYVAYVTARAGRRTVFQLEPQSKAFDNIADTLFKALPEDAAVEEIVKVSPIASLFRRLPAEKLASMVNMFHSEMVFWGVQLGELWETLPESVQKAGVVRRGVNSSDVNAIAGAYNTMRSAWIAAVTAAGMDNLFQVYLPGKAARLIAGDLARWNDLTGGVDSPDLYMFHALPKPWEVIAGDKESNITIITAASKDYLTEEELVSTGWVGPRKNLELETATADPALVHGVIVGNPELATVLRKIGVFSGKPEKLAYFLGY